MLRQVHVLGKAVALLSIMTIASPAATILFQGTFSTDDQVELLQFTLNSDSTVTLQSHGYAGGTVNATTIPDGGFAPNVTIFALLGTDYVQATSDTGGHCGTTQTDPVTGNCDDPYIQTLLSAGTYYLGLTVYDNLPSTGNLADGYKQTGNPGFTCAEGGLTGQFCDVTDALFRTRTGNWAFTIEGVDGTSAVPEPSTLWLAGTLIGALLLRRKSS
jgi:hypothetical protein